MRHSRYGIATIVHTSSLEHVSIKLNRDMFQIYLLSHVLFGKPGSTHRVKPVGMLFRDMLVEALLLGPRLCPPRRRCAEWIVRPRMFGIAAAHVGAYGGVAAAPEARQVACRLHRPVCR
jgi:hypothetical protein